MAKLLGGNSEGRTHGKDALIPIYLGLDVSTTRKEMSMHSFDPEIAKKVGVNAAVLYQNIVWWTQRNAANDRHFHDGRYWTYNSIKAFDALFPYLTTKQIRTALDKLEEAGLIMSGTFNKAGYDRTKWYCPLGQIDLPKKANGDAQEGEPIPDVNTDIKPDTLFGPDDPKPAKRKRAVSLPDGWVPSDRNIEDAMKRGFSTEEINHEAEQFRNYHHAKGSTFKDWDAAWRTWLGNARKFASSRPARGRGGHNALMAGFAAYAAGLED